MLYSAPMKFLFALLTLVVTTFAAAPEVSAPTAVVGLSGAVSLSAKVKTNGSATTVTFKYGTGADPRLTKDVTLVEATTEQTATVVLKGLKDNATYHFDVIAENTTGKTSLDGLDFQLSPQLTAVSVPDVVLGAAAPTHVRQQPTQHVHEPCDHGGVVFGDPALAAHALSRVRR